MKAIGAASPNFPPQREAKPMIRKSRIVLLLLCAAVNLAAILLHPDSRAAVVNGVFLGACLGILVMSGDKR